MTVQGTHNVAVKVLIEIGGYKGQQGISEGQQGSWKYKWELSP